MAATRKRRTGRTRRTRRRRKNTHNKTGKTCQKGSSSSLAKKIGKNKKSVGVGRSEERGNNRNDRRQKLEELSCANTALHSLPRQRKKSEKKKAKEAKKKTTRKQEDEKGKGRKIKAYFPTELNPSDGSCCCCYPIPQDRRGQSTAWPKQRRRKWSTGTCLRFCDNKVNTNNERKQNNMRHTQEWKSGKNRR